MTKEDKELLVRDLCCRLPYGVKCCFVNVEETKHISYTLSAGMLENFINSKDEFKPYLRPMSSMTKVEKEYVEELSEFHCTPDVARSKIDFYLEHHIDFRGLIPKGLAFEAPKDMYKIDRL